MEYGIILLMVLIDFGLMLMDELFFIKEEIQVIHLEIQPGGDLVTCNGSDNRTTGFTPVDSINGSCSMEEQVVPEDINNCMVCLERPSNAILLECGHSGLCVDCATVLWAQARRCPLCRQGFAGVMRIISRDGYSVRCLRD